MAKPATHHEHGDASIKETIESIIVAFILAFTFRAFVVEAFVIPTGSMAPTLLGKHLSVTCPECGYHFKTDSRDKQGVTDRAGMRRAEPYRFQGKDNPLREGPLSLTCPMCRWRFTRDNLRIDPGDRILVLKYVYEFTPPRRWDVVVFRNPKVPTENYIKRLIGLENEHLAIVRGNIYTTKHTDDEGRPTGWKVQVKPPRVQRVVWQPVYHSEYVPLHPEAFGPEPWRSPWVPDDASKWQPLNDGRAFAFEPGDGRPGRLAFDSRGRLYARDYYAYNQFAPPTMQAQFFVEDLRIAASITPADDQLGVMMGLDTQHVKVRGGLDETGLPVLQIGKGDADDGDMVGVATTDTALAPWKAGQTRRVELWHVDHRVCLWVDGRLYAQHDIPLADSLGQSVEADPDYRGPVLSLHQLERGQSPVRRADAFIELRGGGASLRQIDIDRDLYYTPGGSADPLGVLSRPASLGPDEFFCLGDNSPASEDSRRWDRVDEWITYHTQDHSHVDEVLGDTVPGVGPGILPRKLLIGRAFFVYFPAPLRLSPKALGLIPNFGELRFID